MGFFVTLGLFAIALVLNEIFKPSPGNENARPAGLGDFTLPTATESRPVPLVWGTVRLDGPNVIWYGDLRTEAIREKVRTSLFSSSRVITGYRYRLGVQMALCRGELDSIERIFVGDEILYDTQVPGDSTVTINRPDFFGGESNGAGGIVGDVSFRMGSGVQTAPAYLTGVQSVSGQTPAYRGTAYVLLERVLLGTSSSIKPWQFEVRRIPNGLGLSTPSVNSGNDANPMNVIYEILTDDEWGLGQPPADIDEANFRTAADTLLAEGNGFSMVLDSTTPAEELLNELQRQIDGVVYLDRQTGKWVVTLARDDYDIGTVFQADESNIVEIDEFTRGSWAESTNVINVNFFNRSREYQGTYAVAQDMANIRVQGGQIVRSELRFPGVKDPDLAASIAWRELRTASYPLARAKLIGDRTFSVLNPGDVISWSDDDLGISNLPMRVSRIDLGQLDQGRVTVDLVQDVFTVGSASYAPPQDGDWVPLSNDLVNIPLADRQVFEAPRALVNRDPSQPLVPNRVWVGVRNQGDGAIDASIVDTSEVELGTLSAFLLAGELVGVLEPTASTASSFTIEASPDTKDALLAAIEPATTTDIGNSLANLVRIGDEFMAFRSVTSLAGNQIQLNDVVRGLLDTVPPVGGHADNSRVWFLALGGSLTDSAFSPTASVNLRILTQSALDTLTFAEATSSSVTLDNRYVRPYPALRPSSGSTSAYASTTFSLDTSGLFSGSTGNNSRGMEFSFTRRDFRLEDEYRKSSGDPTVLPSDFPAANTTEYRLTVRNDPTGANTLLYQTAWDSTGEPNVNRNLVLAGTDGVVPSELGLTVEARHTVEGVVYEATQDLAVNVAVSSALSTLTNLGSLAALQASNVLVAAGTGTFSLDISDALSNGDVQVRINSGSWVTEIPAGSTTGSFTATLGDNIEFRHNGSDSPNEYRFLDVSPPAGLPAYAIIVT